MNMPALPVTPEEHENKPKSELNRNFEGPRIYVHRIEYDTNAGDFYKSERRVAFIAAETYEIAKALLFKSFKPGSNNQLTSETSHEFEIHGISLVLKKALFEQWKKEFEPLSAVSLINKL